jgi:ring-1,2-phenylacetyl-CoA epoxidase subunit PaaE
MTLEAMPPTGRFMLPESDGAPRHILAVAAGAGITPVMAMLRHGLTREPATRFTLLYGNRTSDDIIFREALEDLKDRHLGRLSVMSVLSREEGDAPLLAGRITPEKLGQVMGRQLPPALIAHAFLCGPGDMIRDLRNALLALGLPRERVHHEFFAPAGGARRPAPPLPASDRSQAAPGTGTDLTVVLDGVRHRLEARLGEPVLEAAIRAGLRVPYSCRGGMCCTCRARLVEGEAEMLVNYSLEPWEIERRFTLTCQAVPRSPRLVVDYDQM